MSAKIVCVVLLLALAQVCLAEELRSNGNGTTCARSDENTRLATPCTLNIQGIVTIVVKVVYTTISNVVFIIQRVFQTAGAILFYAAGLVETYLNLLIPLIESILSLVSTCVTGAPFSESLLKQVKEMLQSYKA